MKCPKCGSELVEEYHIQETYEEYIETGEIIDNEPTPEWCEVCGYSIFDDE